MAAVASIKFTQGPNTDVAGRAVKGTMTDGVVAITNGDNTDVASWLIELLFNPSESAHGAVVGTPVVLGQAVSNTPSANMPQPDAVGSYRVRLTVWDSVGVASVDIRNFAVPDNRGFITPPYQKLPDPLPLLGTGLTGEKPDELNFDGQDNGWLGRVQDGMHATLFRRFDDVHTTLVTSTPFTPSLKGDEGPIWLVDLDTIGADAEFRLPITGLRVGTRIRVVAYTEDATPRTLSVVRQGSYLINGRTQVDMRYPCGGEFVYRGGTEWFMPNASYDYYERSLVAGVENVQVTGFQSVGSSILLDPADFPNGTFDWRAVIETTDGADAAEIRLFNTTLGSAVAGTTLSTTSLTPTSVAATGITLASGLNLYEAQLRLQTTGLPNVATCRQAQIVANWLQP